MASVMKPATLRPSRRAVSASRTRSTRLPVRAVLRVITGVRWMQSHCSRRPAVCGMSQARGLGLYSMLISAGGENSGKLVTLVRQQARSRALDDYRDLVLLDGPPGIGCPVISAVAGATLALMVVEPTLSGAHDLSRVLEMAEHFGVPAAVVVNKADLSDKRTEEIELFCAARAIPLVGRIPYDTVVTEAMVQGVPVTEFTDGPVSQALVDIWGIIKDKLVGGTDVRAEDQPI